MALFKMRWLRRWMRRHTDPIPEAIAFKWKERMSIAYGILAWHTFGLIIYYSVKNRLYDDETTEENGNHGEPSAIRLSRVLNLEKGKIIRFSGFAKIDEIDFDNSTKQSLDD